MVATVNPPPKQETVAFSHVHLYVDHLEDLHVYKTLETELNTFAEQAKSVYELEGKRQLWQTICTSSSSAMTPFVSHGRDVVKQLLAGFGFRVTAARYPQQQQQQQGITRSVLVTSRDPMGVQILVTALEKEDHAQQEQQQVDQSGDEIPYFRAENVRRFYAAHSNRPGIAVLGFLVHDLESIRQRYKKLHPQLLVEVSDEDDQKYNGNNNILEVYAFYKADAGDHSADLGTILRFVQQEQGEENVPTGSNFVLPGLVPVPASFDDASQAAYCDHWVSNVFSRTEFLDTLRDTLGFVPKVDFNAGVVAAGEAQIESTVTGNDSILVTHDASVALRDQSQVYLPINNALSNVGHVHGFLQELGQGIQHLASRVDNLVAFVQRANDARQALGEGFSFLRIPRSYYGILTASQLTSRRMKTDTTTGNDINTDGASLSVLLSPECAAAVMAILRKEGVLLPDGAVDLDFSRDAINAILEHLDDGYLQEYQNNKDEVLDVIGRSRYKNLYSLLRDHLSEETYLGIVRNQILVDIQGEDLLYQIFTSNMLQRQPGDEAPFFEFIQRVCSECLDDSGCRQKIRPGCGGFGIRNFLTLFLSIEVSKAMQDVTNAQQAGDVELEKYAQSMVDCFTDQLSESNPILTEISDAMTDEGYCKEQLILAVQNEQAKEAAEWKAKMNDAAERKQRGNEKLMECSARYNALMKDLRENRMRNNK